MRLEKAIEAWADQIGPYDVVYSIGAACGCASWLRTLHLRQMAGPVDWVKGGGGLLGRVAMIEARFAGWLRPENMRLVGGDERTRFYEDKATGIVFPHDFPTAIPFRQALAEAQERYRRRQERFYRTVGEAEVEPTGDRRVRCAVAPHAFARAKGNRARWSLSWGLDGSLRQRGAVTSCSAQGGSPSKN